ncbi:hypothetical protein KCMC57_up01440 [Kitasatospora sp. CMC57]|uniref:Ricin B lectin domain-containing protein n=1 Tax=Kitasatospora sp. CMC57 TaxID=3231513 RepID=A0AB33JR55_9ACTN
MATASATCLAAAGLALAPAGDASAAGAPQGGHVYTLTAANSGKNAAVLGDSVADGAAAVQKTASGGPGQLWEAADHGDGTFSLVDINSGNCIDVPSGPVNPETPIIQWLCPLSGAHLPDRALPFGVPSAGRHRSGTARGFLRHNRHPVIPSSSRAGTTPSANVRATPSRAIRACSNQDSRPGHAIRRRGRASAWPTDPCLALRSHAEASRTRPQSRRHRPPRHHRGPGVLSSVMRQKF